MANLSTLSGATGKPYVVHKEALDGSLMEKFINLLMVAGKKTVAHKVFYAAGYQFLRLTNKKKQTPTRPTIRQRVTDSKVEYKNRFLLQLQIAVRNVQPSLEGRKCRVAGTTKTIPAIVSVQRGYVLAMRWIIESAKRKKKLSKLPFSQCLAQEFLDAYQKQGRPRQRRDQYHKMCEGNRGYLRYRWW